MRNMFSNPKGCLANNSDGAVNDRVHSHIEALLAIAVNGMPQICLAQMQAIQY